MSFVNFYQLLKISFYPPSALGQMAFAWMKTEEENFLIAWERYFSTFEPLLSALGAI